MSASPKKLFDAGQTRAAVATDMLLAMGSNGITWALTAQGIADLAASLDVQGFKRYYIQPGLSTYSLSTTPTDIFDDSDYPLTFPASWFDGSGGAAGVGREILVRIPAGYVISGADNFTIQVFLHNEDNDTDYSIGFFDFEQPADDDDYVMRIFIAPYSLSAKVDAQLYWNSNIDPQRNKVYNVSLELVGPWTLHVVAVTSGGSDVTLNLCNPTVDIIHPPALA